MEKELFDDNLAEGTVLAGTERAPTIVRARDAASLSPDEEEEDLMEDVESEPDEAMQMFGTAARDIMGGLEGEKLYNEEDFGELSEEEEVREKVAKVRVRDLFRPDELADHFMLETDRLIQHIDLPERVQLELPTAIMSQLRDRFFRHEQQVNKADDIEIVGLVKDLMAGFGDILKPQPGEAREEAEWIYSNAFDAGMVSKSTSRDHVLRKVYHAPRNKDMAKDAIERVVALLRWEEIYDEHTECHYSGPREVPFIAQFRKEAVGFPEVFNMHDLWLIRDWNIKWLETKARRQNLCQLFEHVQALQQSYPDAVFAKQVDGEDLAMAARAQSEEALQDVQDYFQLLFAADFAAARAVVGSENLTVAVDARRRVSNVDEENNYGSDRLHGGDAGIAAPTSTRQGRKRSGRRTQFEIFMKAGLLPMLQAFGLTPIQLSHNLHMGYQRYQPDTPAEEPLLVAARYVSEVCDTPAKALEAAIVCKALEFAAHPAVRAAMRFKFNERATVTIRATHKGRTEIDEWHPYARFRYLDNKPVSTLVDDEFLWMQRAHNEGYVVMTISADHSSEVCDRRRLVRQDQFWDELDSLFLSDMADVLHAKWDEARRRVLRTAFSTILFPLFEANLRAKLQNEAELFVEEQCANYVRSIVNHAPPRTYGEPGHEQELDGEPVVMAIAVGDQETPTYAVLLNQAGELVDHLQLNWVLLRRNTRREGEQARRTEDWARLKAFVDNRKPDVLVVGADSREAYSFRDDVRRELTANEPPEYCLPSIEFVDPMVAKIFMESVRGEREFKEVPSKVRYAVSLGRRFQCPEVEFAGLFNQEKEILFLKIHPLQDMLPPARLMSALEKEIITVVNRQGVDINRALSSLHHTQALQFVAGLGPRKTVFLVNALKRSDVGGRLRSRESLPMDGDLGNGVTHSCAGFLRVHRVAEDDFVDDDATVDILDNTRIHPESYDIARKIAADAMEYEPTGQDAMSLPSRDHTHQAIHEVS